MSEVKEEQNGTEDCFPILLHKLASSPAPAPGSPIT